MAWPGSFALTFDTELIWGSFDHLTVGEFERRYPDVRAIIKELVALLESYDVPATWALVGHLYLDHCERSSRGIAHPELVPPAQSWYAHDWYGQDPCTDRRRDPLWYGDDIVDALLRAGGGQEIGCHSFGHALFGDPSMTVDAVRSDLARCRSLAEERGVSCAASSFQGTSRAITR